MREEKVQTRQFKVGMVVTCSFPANHGTPGGIVKMCNDLATAGCQSHVITYNSREYEAEFEFPIHRIPSLGTPRGKLGVGPSLRRVFFDLMLVFKTIEVILRHKIDIIDAHNYEAQLIGFVAKLLTGRPLVYHAHNNMIDELPQYEKMRPKFLWVWIAKLLDFLVPRTADHIIAISGTLRDFLLAEGISPHKISHIPLSVSLDMFNGDSGNLPGKYRLPQGPKIVYTGTLDIFQRLDYLLSAFASLAARFSELSLVIVANQFNGAQVEKVKAQASELGISEQVHLILDSSIEDLPFLIGSCDVAVVSRPECPGFPIKILNYMASGTAIVCFEGSAKILKDGETALLARDHDLKGFTENIARLLEDPALRMSLGQQAKRAVRELQPQIGSLVEVYEGLLDGQARARSAHV